MNGKSVKLLFAQADKNVLAPILEALGAKGINVSEGSPEGDEILLAALSENFYADKSLTDALLAAVGKGGDKVLPLQLDKAVIPDDIKNAIYARNIIPVSAEYHTGERARRRSRGGPHYRRAPGKKEQTSRRAHSGRSSPARTGSLYGCPEYAGHSCTGDGSRA